MAATIGVRATETFICLDGKTPCVVLKNTPGTLLGVRYAGREYYLLVRWGVWVSDGEGSETSIIRPGKEIMSPPHAVEYVDG